MAIEYTPDQQRVIDIRGKNVLVAAAAGSGKTAVLVERIIQRITDKENPIDIDRLLIVTFTNAAAAQMKERIYQAIIKKQEVEPDDANLARQASLVHTAMITTIHSFCLFLLHNHFHEIGLDPSFRIADEGEISLMQEEVMKELLEESFEKKEAAFLQCKKYFAPRIKDRALADTVLKLYRFAMSYPWPAKWLLACKDDFAIADEETLEESAFVKLALDYARQYLEEDKKLAGQMMELCAQSDGPYMYMPACESDLALIERLMMLRTYKEAYEAFLGTEFQALSRKKDETVSGDKRDKVKAIRDIIKSDIKKCREQFFFASQEETLAGLLQAKEAVGALIDLTILYMERFAERKREKNIIDFSDMEHLALSVLMRGENNEPTETALSYREYFEEIMIDEYQDSNLVQELLLLAISREDAELANNRFMVGDIKQSIYRFRLARPEIFLEKYNKYDAKSGNDGCVRIDLRKNFRSRKEVIESVNLICGRVMTNLVGGVSYDDRSALYLGADYPQTKGADYGTELLLYESGGQEEDNHYNKREKEAFMVAAKIKELVGKFPVTDETSKEPRPAKYGDIVILLRSNQGWEEHFKRVLTMQQIPVHTESRTGYFEADEIQSVMNFLRVLCNPYGEIALCACLTSVFGGMDSAGLAKLRIIDKEGKLYENLQKSENDKCVTFIKRLEKFRTMSDYTEIYDLLCAIFKEYHYLEYVTAMPGGEQRKANVEMLLEKAVAYEKTSYHGLYSFIHYMEKLQKYEVDFGEADTAEEFADAVRIMSIHKSKGLEFPICFMSGMAKKMNLMDTRSSLIMDVDYGLAVNVIDSERRIRTRSMRKEVLAQKLKMDSLGEELRILYVGLTRAKEKLFLSGTLTDYEAYMEKLSLWADDKEPIPFSKLGSAASMLEYVLSAVGREGLKTSVWHDKDLGIQSMAQMFSKEALEKLFQKRIMGTSGKQRILEKERENYEELWQKFHFQYPSAYLKNLYTKTSVSELKKAHIHEDEETNVMFETEIQKPYLPEFMEEEKKTSGTSRGSAYHRVLELLDYGRLYGLYLEKSEGRFQPLEKTELWQFVKGQMRLIADSGRMSEDITLVSPKKIAVFAGTRTAYRMAHAAYMGKLYREQPFVMAIDANRIVPEIREGREKVLIQGIIDVFFHEKDETTGEEYVVLLDYKTDRVESSQELVRRYCLQLDYYAEALEKLTGMPVREKWIYGFYKEKEIAL